MEIGGVTTASEFHYMRNKTYATQDDWLPQETRLNIIDEVSFAGYHSLWLELESFPAEGYRMQRISIRESCHVFSWCFCQLETIDKDVIYKQVDGIYWNNLSTV
jgi:hypothetical protein